MVNRLTVVLEQPEYSGLLEMAISELRTPQEQLRYLLRQELKRRGLFPKPVHSNYSDCSTQSNSSSQEDL